MPPTPAPPEPFLVLPGGFPPDTLGFALRTTISVLLSYLVSFWLQLDSASSAGICVAIVAQATPGMALSKAYWRMGGTVLGCVVALAVVGGFGQDRTMLLWAFCAWLGACTAVASLLRDFRAYGAVLAGYTVGIIAVSDVDAPSRAFDSAVNRGAAIAVGIVSVAVVNELFAPAGAWEAVTGALRGQLATVTALALRALGGTAEEGAADQVPAADGHPDGTAAEDGLSDAACARRGAAILALRTQAGYVTAELPDGRLRAEGARSTIAALLTMLSAARVLARLLRHPLPDPALRARVTAAARTLQAPDTGADELPAPAAPRPTRPPNPGPGPGQTPGQTPGPAPAPEGPPPAERPPEPDPPAPATPEAALLLASLTDLLDSRGHALAGLRSLAQGAPLDRHVQLPAHHDVVGALLNAARTMIATGLGATFCIYSGWSDSTQMLVQQAAFTALLGMSPDPTRGGMAIALALPLPMLFAAVIKFGLLPQVSGFVPFALALAPFVFLINLLARHPRTAGPGGSMLLYLLLVLEPENPQDYDLAAFLNTCAAQVVAVVFMVVAFRLILPVSPRRRLVRVAESISADLRRRLRRGARGEAREDPVRLTVLHYDRLALALQWLGRPSRARLAVLSRLCALSELDSALCRARSGLLAARDGVASAPAGVSPARAGGASIAARGGSGRAPDQDQAILAAEAALAHPRPGALAAAAAGLLAAPGSATPALMTAAAGLLGASRQLEAQRRLLRRLGLVPA